jgi:hypothetical protein
MSILSVTVTRPKPGRTRDSIAMGVQAAKLLARVGAGDCRLVVAEAAGEAAGTQVFTIEFDTNEAFGVFSDKAAVDPQIEALSDRLYAEDSPTVVEFQGIVTEIPLGGRSGRGRVIESYISRPKPGQLEAAIELTRRAFTFLEKHGAVSSRLFQQTIAGSQSDTLVASWEFDSMQALGKAGDAFMNDPEGIALGQLVARADTPITVVNAGIYREVPLS